MSFDARRPSKMRTVQVQPVSVDGSSVLISIARAVIARGLFILHSMITIAQTVSIADREAIWGFALISLLIVFEGSYSIIMRAGDERKWFCTSLAMYIISTAPPIWILESKMCEMRAAGTIRQFGFPLSPKRIPDGQWKSCQSLSRRRVDLEVARYGWGITKYLEAGEGELRLQILEQLLLVTLILGRWILPKGDISREQLSQAISSDIVEFFDVFKEKTVYTNTRLQQIVLAAWTLSLFQFPFVLTVSRARKMRVAITKTYEELITPTRRRNLWQIFHDVDIWAIFLANFLQDMPFLLVRLFLMVQYRLFTYTLIFFTSKNLLVIALQTYRAFILLNDRYINPQPDLGILDVPLLDVNSEHQHHKSPSSRHKKKRARDSEKEHLYPKSRPHRKHRRAMEVLEENP